MIKDKNNLYHLLGTGLKAKDKNDVAIDNYWPDAIVTNQPMQAGNWMGDVIELPVGTACNFLEPCDDGTCGAYTCGDYQIAVTKDELNNQFIFTIIDKNEAEENVASTPNLEGLEGLDGLDQPMDTPILDEGACVDMSSENDSIKIDDILFSIANEKGISITDLTADGDTVAIVQDYFPGTSKEDIANALEDIQNIVADANKIIVKDKNGYEDVTVGELADKLQGFLDELSNYDPEQKVKVASNTYFVNSTWFMQFGSAGFVSLDPIDVEDEDEDEDDGMYDSNSIVVGNTDKTTAGATPIEKPEVPTTGNVESTSFQMNAPTVKDKNEYPEDVSEEGINLVTEAEEGEGIDVGHEEAVEAGEGIVLTAEDSEEGEGINLATDGEAGDGIAVGTDKNNIASDGTSGDVVPNPFETICDEIDNSGDKVSAYKAIISKLADDPDISIEDKVALVTLS